MEKEKQAKETKHFNLQRFHIAINQNRNFARQPTSSDKNSKTNDNSSSCCTCN